MRLLFLILFVASSYIASAQRIIENPTFKVREGNIFTINKIELADDYTKLYINIIFRPNWWVTYDKSYHLQDVSTGVKYYPTAIEGMEFNKETYLPASGTMDIVITYPPLPKGTTTVHLLCESGDAEFNTYDISILMPEKRSGSLDDMLGNWFAKDSGQGWVLGLYDSVVIFDNKLWKYAQIKRKGKRATISIQEKNNVRKLEIKQVAGGCIEVVADRGKATLCSRERAKSLSLARSDDDSKPFFRRDTAVIQGYLRGYDPRFNFSTAIVYAENSLTRESFPTVITIYPDGRFEGRLPLAYPMTAYTVLNKTSLSVYIEPGSTVTIFIDYEDIMAKSRSRGLIERINGIEFMGPLSVMNRVVADAQWRFKWDYKTLKDTHVLTPEQYKEKMQGILPRWNAVADSVINADNYSPKVARMLKNHVLLTYTTGLLDFDLYRTIDAMEDSTNLVLKENTKESYFDFLRSVPLDDSTLLSSSSFSVFINRFEFSGLLNRDLRYEPSDMLRSHIQNDSINDATITQFFNTDHTPLMQQIAFVRNSNYLVQNFNDKDVAKKYVEHLKKYVTSPVLVGELDRIYSSCYDQTSGFYDLPQGDKGTQILSSITDKYKGKYVLVDFWGIGCGPCIAGIKGSKELRAKLRGGADIAFVFITSEDSSPLKAYNTLVENEICGDGSYRVSESDYHYLRQLFKFNGIPHYRTLNRKGQVLRKSLSYYSLEKDLEALLESEKKNSSKSPIK